MAIKTRKIKGSDARGVKVTEKNIDDLVQWIQNNGIAGAQYRWDTKDGLTSNHRIAIWTRKGLRVAKLGDVVRQDIDANKKRWVSVVKAADFVGFEK